MVEEDFMTDRTRAAGARIEAECSYQIDHPDAVAILLRSIAVIGDA